ncbi:MAG TPA: amidohydrolase family protein [Polyangiales bacterium]
MRGIAASWLLSGDGQSAPLRDGAVVLDEAERIVAVGPAAVLRRDHAAAHWEQHAAVLTPGLVNAHTHLELSALRGQVPGGGGFVPWVDALVAARVRLQPEANGEAIDQAVSELLQAGVVLVGDVSNSLAAVDTLGAVPILGWVFHEVFGMRKDVGEVTLGLARQARAQRPHWPANLRYALAPHTAYTLHPDVLREIVVAADGGDARTSLHLAEHAAERAFLQTGGGAIAQWLSARGASTLDWTVPGCDAVSYAQRLGVLGPRVIAVHLCDARPDEIAQVAAAGSPVVLCPRSNLHIELKLPPLLEILRAGIHPALGTDSLASNASLDPLAEARALRQRFPSVAPRQLLAMATSYGAEVLGFAHLVGRLAPGLSPGVIAFEHGSSAVDDPERYVLEHDKAPRRVLSRPAYQRSAPLTEIHA